MDVTINWRNANVAEMFATPRYVLKDGVLVVEEGQLRRAPAGRWLHVRPGYDDAVTRDLERWFNHYGTVSFANYPVAGVRDAAVSTTEKRSSRAGRNALHCILDTIVPE